ncbi:glutamine--tRNA ligase/YqeY domain fusion protein [uncultured Tyzzerella sp.]|uniref:glutamine--tRNA ligase/YqeY domain fusion protein n=1 Tax=uncultured Tyzzerella sp. TaxID=2321398 RepID=UPI0029435FB7|nr:glutamine--tRNA ligase/YqeY domain fusion protein [uncultured Tyzzerella sp.]
MENENNNLSQTGNFIHNYIQKDLEGKLNKIHTRFPPEPNGYLHIGHAKSICLNFGLADYYGGKCNLRFDDTNPAKEDDEFVRSIKEDIEWLGFDWEDRLYFASSYFEKMYDCAVELIKKGKAFVCDLTPQEIREKRGSLNAPGEESPYRNRSIEENLDLFERMRKGEFKDGEKTLRAKIDMSSPNINMRDPVIYRIAHIPHHKTGNDWCIYPMYDFAHPLEDAFEEITHSICTMEFEDHRPLYNWFVNELDFKVKPRQIEFAKLNLSNTIMGKRYLRQLVEEGKVDGWDDPRLVTLSGIRRRGYTPESIKNFCQMVGVSKASSVVDTAQLEYCIREDLKDKVNVVMAVLDPIKVVITNYPEDMEEALTIENNPENEELGTREVMFSRELYIERDDFLEDAPKKFFRLSVGKEVRLKGAYFIMCNEVIKDENGNIIELRCTYDPETKSGSGFTGRKVKGTIHWVSAKHAVKATVNLYDSLVIPSLEDEKELIENENSLIVLDNAYIEPSILSANKMDRFQFIRNGYFVADSKHFDKNNLVFNRIVSLKSSFKP